MRQSDARVEYVQWLRAVRNLSLHTVRAYEGDVLALERHIGAATNITSLTRVQLVDFVEAQRSAGLASRSLKRRAAGVRSYCKWLACTGRLEADPWSEVVVEAGRSRVLPRHVPAQELTRLLVALRDAAGIGHEPAPDAELVRPTAATTLLSVSLMLATGLRVGEVCTIRHRDVDVAGRTVRVVGKGARERQVYLTNDWLTGLVSAYLTTRTALAVEHEWLLFNARGAPLQPASVRERVVRAAYGAGVHLRVTPHMLRHSAATQLIEAGVDIRYIQRLLGHASLTTTELYTHVADHALRRVVSGADVLGRSFARDN